MRSTSRCRRYDILSPEEIDALKEKWDGHPWPAKISITDLTHRIIDWGADAVLNHPADFELRWQLMVTLFKLHEIFCTYRSNSTKEIHGPGGIAAVLGISREALYASMKKMGVVPQNFRNVGAQFQSVLLSSNLCKALVLEILSMQSPPSPAPTA